MTRTSLVGPLVTRGPGSAGGARRPIYGSGIRDGRPGMPDETEGGTRAANPAMPMRCLGNGPGTCLALPCIGRGLSDIADRRAGLIGILALVGLAPHGFAT